MGPDSGSSITMRLPFLPDVFLLGSCGRAIESLWSNSAKHYYYISMAFFAARDIVRVDDTTIGITLLYRLSRMSSIGTQSSLQHIFCHPLWQCLRIHPPPKIVIMSNRPLTPRARLGRKPSFPRLAAVLSLGQRLRLPCQTAFSRYLHLWHFF